MPTDINTLIEQAREHVRLHPPTQAEKDEHAISFVLGNLNASTNHQTTRDKVEAQYYRLERDACLAKIAELEALLGGQVAMQGDEDANRQRLDWLLDQLSPSMFADHGIAALRGVATAMKADGVYRQRQNGIEHIDQVRVRAQTNESGAAAESAKD